MFRALQRIFNRTLSTAFQQWRDVAVSAYHLRQTQTKIIKRLSNLVLSRAWSTWRLRVAEASAQSHLMEKVLMAWSNRCVCVGG